MGAREAGNRSLVLLSCPAPLAFWWAQLAEKPLLFFR